MEKMEHIFSVLASKTRGLRSPQNLFLILILGIAAFLRLYRIADYMVFLGDEGRDVLVEYNILHGHLTLLGPTSSVGGFFLGPIYYYMAAPFLWLFHYHPVGPSIMVAILGIATVFLIYKICAEFFDRKVAVVASALYAISPLVIVNSKSSWNPNVMPFFSLLTLYTLYQGVRKENWKLIFTAGFLLGIALQLHYLATFLGVIIFFYLTIFTFYKNKFGIGKERIKDLFINYISIGVGFMVGFSPFLVFELRHGFRNTQNILNFIFASKDTGPGPDFLTIIHGVFFRLFADLLTAFPDLSRYTEFSQSEISVWSYFAWGLGIFSVIFFLWKFFNVKKDRENLLRYSLLLFWLFFGIFLFGFYKKSIYDYYFGFIFPLPFILTGISLTGLWNFQKYLGKMLALGILLVLIFINVSQSPIAKEPNRQVNQAKTLADFILDKTADRPFNFALITGGNSDHAYRYFFKLAGRDPVTILNPAVDSQRKSITNQLFVICEMKECQPLGNSLWEVAGFGRADIAGVWNVSVLKVYKLVHYHGPQE